MPDVPYLIVTSSLATWKF